MGGSLSIVTYIIFFWLQKPVSGKMKKTHENKLSIVPSQMFVLTFQTRLYIDKGWLNFSFNTQTFLFYTNLPFICRIIENSRRNVSMKCGIHLTIWKNKLFSKHVFMLINFIYRNKNASEIAKKWCSSMHAVLAGVEISLEDRRIQHLTIRVFRIFLVRQSIGLKFQR